MNLQLLSIPDSEMVHTDFCVCHVVLEHMHVRACELSTEAGVQPPVTTYCGLNEMSPISLWHLNTWSPAGSSVSGGLGSVALLEEVYP